MKTSYQRWLGVFFLTSVVLSIAIGVGCNGNSGAPGQAPVGQDERFRVTPDPSPSVTPSSAAQSVTVTIEAGASSKGADAFGQNPLKIATGTTVTWVNNDSVAHTVTSEDGTLDSPLLNPGDSFTHTFNEPGSFSYFCTVHPNMVGVVEVSGEPVSSSTPTL